MSELVKRIISGCLFGALSLCLVLYGGTILLLYLGLLSGCLVWETLKFDLKPKNSLIRLIVIFLCALSPIVILNPEFMSLYFICTIVLFWVAVDGDIVLFAVLNYILGSVSLLLYMLNTESIEFSNWSLIFMILIVCSTDIGGYFLGKAFKGPKVFPSISPNKTWSGIIGGWSLSILVAWFVFQFLDNDSINIFVLTLFLSISSQLGDFFESMIKRNYGLKNSGFILPGHGGLFDRLDGFLAAIYAYYLFSKIGL